MQRKIFEVTVPRRALRYGLGGMLWVPLALAGMAVALRRRRRRPDLAWGATAALSLGAMVGVVLKLAWRAGAMTRYLIFTFPGVPLLAAWSVRRRPAWGAVLLGLVVVQGGALVAGDVVMHRWPEAEERPWVDQMRAFSAALPNDATVLLFANQDAADYLLFAPPRGSGRRVVPWGNRAITPAELGREVIARRIDWVVMETGSEVGRHWDPPFVVRPAAEWFRGNPEWRVVTADGVTTGLLFARVRPWEGGVAR